MNNETTTPEEKKLPEWEEIFCHHCLNWEAFPWEDKCPEGCGQKHVGVKGLCRAKLPELGGGNDGTQGQWPVTNFDDWCTPGRQLVINFLTEPEEE